MKKITKIFFYILLLIYATIFIVMLYNQIAMHMSSDVLSNDAFVDTRKAVTFGLLHSAINVAYTLIAIFALKRPKIIPIILVLGVAISVIMRFVPMWILGNVSFFSLPLVCRLIVMLLLFFLWRKEEPSQSETA